MKTQRQPLNPKKKSKTTKLTVNFPVYLCFSVWSNVEHRIENVFVRTCRYASDENSFWWFSFLAGMARHIGSTGLWENNKAFSHDWTFLWIILCSSRRSLLSTRMNLCRRAKLYGHVSACSTVCLCTFLTAMNFQPILMELMERRIRKRNTSSSSSSTGERVNAARLHISHITMLGGLPVCRHCRTQCWPVRCPHPIALPWCSTATVAENHFYSNYPNLPDPLFLCWLSADALTVPVLVRYLSCYIPKLCVLNGFFSFVCLFVSLAVTIHNSPQ